MESAAEKWARHRGARAQEAIARRAHEAAERTVEAALHVLAGARRAWAEAARVSRVTREEAQTAQRWEDTWGQTG